MTQTLTLRRPDDWHLHLRDGAMLKAVAPHSAGFRPRDHHAEPGAPGGDGRAGRGLSRPDHGGPARGRGVAAADDAVSDRATDPADVVAAFQAGIIRAVKLYPAGATTNSDSGVTDMDRVRPVLEAMAEHGITLCVHGEVTDAAVDIFDREAVFIDRVLDPIRRKVPGLRVVMEHITTSDGVDYARSGGDDLAATITTHHLVINRNAILAGGIRPHYYCLPVAKRESHRLALRQAATSGEGRFFLGTDSAPHPDSAKLQPCGCAGCFTAPNTMSILAQVFQDDGALDRLEAFTSLNGAAFYRMAPSEDRITLVRRDTPAPYPATISAGDEVVTVFDPGFPLYWHPETA